MTNILQKALKAITTIRNLGDEDEWSTETIGERFGVRYTDETHADALVDEGWTDKAAARARRKELRAAGGINVRVVKITTRWRRKLQKVALENVEPS
jgi:hypothetical protein